MSAKRLKIHAMRAATTALTVIVVGGPMVYVASGFYDHDLRCLALLVAGAFAGMAGTLTWRTPWWRQWTQ